MIDAYEIGIQLLLQDDVSAGLAVIDKELAEVDRAIAATSAGLLLLAQTAERASRAVSATAAGKAASSVVRPSVERATSVPDPETKLVPTAEVEPSGAASAAPPPPPNVAAAPSVAPATNSFEANTTSFPREASSPPPVTSSATPVASSAAPDVGDRDRMVRLPEVTSSPSSAPPPAVTAQPAAPADSRQDASASAGATAAPIFKNETVAAPSVAPPVVTASIDAPERRQASRAQQDVGTIAFVPPKPARERSTAPKVRAEGRRSAPEPSSAAGAMSSSVQAQQGESGEASGTVLLDGRLVGQWLGDAMARDASRPPSGTSFFDPRQTPAWHNSGAL